MVPAALSGADNPLHVTVEEYGFLPADKDAFIDGLPDVKGLVPCPLPLCSMRSASCICITWGTPFACALGYHKGENISMKRFQTHMYVF